MEKQENNKSLIMLLIILVFTAGLFFLMSIKDNSIEKVNNIKKNNSIIVKKINDTVVKKELINTKKKDYKLSETYKKCLSRGLGEKECFYREIKKNVTKEDNVELCNYLEEQKQRNICKDNYYRGLALKESKVGYCDYVTNKDDCILMIYGNKARKEDNKELCNSLTNTDLQLRCKDYVDEMKMMKIENKTKENEFPENYIIDKPQI